VNSHLDDLQKKKSALLCTVREFREGNRPSFTCCNHYPAPGGQQKPVAPDPRLSQTRRVEMPRSSRGQKAQ
jgi:hypothetical protein